MTEPLVVRVVGTPVPQGSARAFVRGGRAVVTSANPRLRPWRDTVTAAAQQAMADAGWGTLSRPVEVRLVFTLPRPAGHWAKDGSVRRAAPARPGRPDIDKLVRSSLDSLTDARVFLDDSLVVEVTASKRYVESPSEVPGLFARVAEVLR